MTDAIRLRYASTCRSCNASLPAGAFATWDRSTKTAMCANCRDAVPSVPAGVVPTGTSTVVPNISPIRLRYAAECSACGASMAPGTTVQWDKSSKRAAHQICPADARLTVSMAAVTVEDAGFDVGVAGGSARRIADRQQAKRDKAREQRAVAVRAAHPRAGNLILKAQALLAEPETPTSWQKGAVGEEAAGRTFDQLTAEGFQVLHDRRKPGTKWNIDHIVVGSMGVYVIDAKHFAGRLEIRSTGSILRPGPNRVFVKGRAQDKRVAAMAWQMDCIRAAVGDLVVGYGGVIKPVLCFIGVDLGFAQKPQLVGHDNVLVTWPRRFVKDVGRDGPLTAAQITEVARAIAGALPAAVAASVAR